MNSFFLRNHRVLAMSALFSALSLVTSFSLNAFQDTQQQVLAKLTGKLPIKEEIKLTNRYEQANREMVADYLVEQLEWFCDGAFKDPYSETGTNVVAAIRATTESSDWIVLGAHYDSVKDSPGANDNASGVALVYEVAKHIASLSERKYNVWIVFFDEEEKGLIGSRDFAAKMKKDEINILSAHTIDQMGWDNDGDRGIELEMPDEALLAHYQKVAQDHEISFPIHTTQVTSTDHTAFRELGFKAIGITEEYKNRDTTPHYHKSTDTYETIDLEYLQSTTAYMKLVFEAFLEN